MTDTHVVSAPEKALPHVVTGLIAKRQEIAGQIENLQAKLRQATIDLDHVEASLRIFASDIDMLALGTRRVPTAHHAFKGETTRIVRHSVATFQRLNLVLRGSGGNLAGMTATTIYVYLPREATPVWAPVDAEHVRYNIYRILDCRGEDEHVEFWNGLSVRCRLKHFDDGDFLVAYEAVNG